jgi:hypothetical protein
MRLSKMLFGGAGGTYPQVGYMHGPGSRAEQNRPMQVSKARGMCVVAQ